VALNLVKVVIALAFPTVVFVVFNRFQEARSGRDVTLAHMQPVVKPLNMRLHYNVDDAVRFWGALGDNGRRAEEAYLKLDLTFPLIYGGALMISLGWLLMASGTTWRPWLVMLPVVVGMIGDWTENLIQLDQLPRYMPSGPSGLDAGAILQSSVATDIKLGGIAVASVVAFWLAGTLLTRSSSR